MSVINGTECEIEYLTPKQSEVFHAQFVQKKLGISLSEFEARKASGYYKDVDWDSVPGLVDVAMMLGL